MKTATITLQLEDDKFEAMEKVLIAHGIYKYQIKHWDFYVINTYYDTERYLEIHNGDLNKAYQDMRYDF